MSGWSARDEVTQKNHARTEVSAWKSTRPRNVSKERVRGIATNMIGPFNKRSVTAANHPVQKSIETDRIYSGTQDSATRHNRQ